MQRDKVLGYALVRMDTFQWQTKSFLCKIELDELQICTFNSNE